MNDILKYDNTFNEGMFITKVNNIFIMLHTAVMMDDLDRAKHFLSNEVYEKYKDKLDKLNFNHERQMYDELNVKETIIDGFNIVEDKIVINVTIISRYMDYIINKDTGNYIRGINDRRVEKVNKLVFSKTINSTYTKTSQKCPTCGASIDVNSNGKCSYCGSIFNADKYDWILLSIETI